MKFTHVESFNRLDFLLGVTRAISECEGKNGDHKLGWKLDDTHFKF
jgi:hypothetical protein